MSAAANAAFHRCLAVTAVLAMACCQAGCIATKYKLAKKNVPPAQSLNVLFPGAGPIQVTLAALITYKGPGSWKREALWDEYVVTLENHGGQPLSIDSTKLADPAGTSYLAGSDPWALEKKSRQLEKQYRDHGLAYVRAAAPSIIIAGTGAAGGAIAGATYVSAAAAGAALATIAALPIYYVTVVTINHHNKTMVTTEFNRRRLPLPLTLAAGETRTGSLFYPTVRNPSSLELEWSSGSTSGQSVLQLEFLQGLHVPPTAAAAAPKPVSN